MKPRKQRVPIETGSGNVFADIGVKNPQESLAKAHLLYRVTRILDERGLSRAAAAKILGVDQPKISALVRGRMEMFSVERLLRFLNALDQDVRIVVAPKPRGREARTSVEAA